MSGHVWYFCCISVHTLLVSSLAMSDTAASTNNSYTAGQDASILCCQREGDREDSLPDICYQILFNNYLATLEENLQNSIQNPILKFLSMLGIFIGFVLGLGLLTVVTCYRPRKAVEVVMCVENYNCNQCSFQEEELPQVLTLAQYNAYIVQPPDYASVLRREMAELPTYSDLSGNHLKIPIPNSKA